MRRSSQNSYRERERRGREWRGEQGSHHEDFGSPHDQGGEHNFEGSQRFRSSDYPRGRGQTEWPTAARQEWESEQRGREYENRDQEDYRQWEHPQQGRYYAGEPYDEQQGAEDWDQSDEMYGGRSGQRGEYEQEYYSGPQPSYGYDERREGYRQGYGGRTFREEGGQDWERRGPERGYREGQEQQRFGRREPGHSQEPERRYSGQDQRRQWESRGWDRENQRGEQGYRRPRGDSGHGYQSEQWGQGGGGQQERWGEQRRYGSESGRPMQGAERRSAGWRQPSGRREQAYRDDEQEYERWLAEHKDLPPESEGERQLEGLQEEARHRRESGEPRSRRLVATGERTEGTRERTRQGRSMPTRSRSTEGRETRTSRIRARTQR